MGRIHCEKNSIQQVVDVKKTAKNKIIKKLKSRG